MFRLASMPNTISIFGRWLMPMTCLSLCIPWARRERPNLRWVHWGNALKPFRSSLQCTISLPHSFFQAMSSVCEDKLRTNLHHQLRRSHSLDGITPSPVSSKAILSWHPPEFLSYLYFIISHPKLRPGSSNLRADAFLLLFVLFNSHEIATTPEQHWLLLACGLLGYQLMHCDISVVSACVPCVAVRSSSRRRCMQE